ncbi:hypothetical protein V8E55_003279 [Tylopilus felleus]
MGKEDAGGSRAVREKKECEEQERREAEEHAKEEAEHAKKEAERMCKEKKVAEKEKSKEREKGSQSGCRDTPIEILSEGEEQPKKLQKKRKTPAMLTRGCWSCNMQGVECVLQKALKGTACVSCAKAHVSCTMPGDDREVEVEDGEPQKKKMRVEVVILVTGGSGLSQGPGTTEAVLLEVMREMARSLGSIVVDVTGLHEEVYGVREDQKRAKRMREEEVQMEKKVEKEKEVEKETEKEDKGVDMEETEKEAEAETGAEEETMEWSI